MEKKVASGIMLTLLLIAALTLTFNIGNVKASGTIYITSDYTFTDNVYEPIVVLADNIVVDGNGYALQGTGSETGIDLTERSNVTIKNMRIKAFSYGVLLNMSSNNRLFGNNITNNNWCGILLESSNDNSIYGNNITNNLNFGIELSGSSYNSLYDNILSYNEDPVYLSDSSHNSLFGNTVINNMGGIRVDGSYNILFQNTAANNYVGISLGGAHNTLYGNIITNNSVNGIGLGGFNNSLYENHITNNEQGIVIWYASDNIIFHNSFADNTEEVHIYTSGYANVWDDGYPSGGNYWSDYEERYPDAEELDGSGIWDTPYVIDADNRDRYPLMNPWTPTPDFLVAASPTSLAIQQGGSDTSVIIVTSIGGFNQPVQLTLSGAPLLGVTVTLNPGQVSPPPYGSTTSTLTVSVDTTATPRSHTLTVTGTSGTLTHSADIILEITALPYEWTFAIITDLHIGREYSDYNGESYYVAKRLEEVVKWINENHEYARYNIKFVMVLGDISNEGKPSELRKAKDILDDLETPYFPVIGNHDVKEKLSAENYKAVFDKTFFISQFGKLGLEEGENWWEDQSPELQNYAFTYREMSFVCLDFVSRSSSVLNPNWEAFAHDVTKNWLKEHISKSNVVLFSHHALVAVEMLEVDYSFDDDTLGDMETFIGSDGWKNVLANFAGHIHGFWGYDWPVLNPKVFMNANVDYSKEKPTVYIKHDADELELKLEPERPTPGGIPVVTTEALMVSSNKPIPKGIIRIVKVMSEEIDYSIVDGEFRALNPCFREIDMAEWRPPWKFIVEFEVYAFAKRFTQERPGRYIMDYGDGTMPESKDSSNWKNEVQFEHDYKRGKHYNVTLTVIGWTPGGKRIEEEIIRGIYVPTLLSIGAFSPVDIAVTDPDGRMINKQLNEIPGADYVEVDLNEDGDFDDLVLIPNSLDGNYVVLLIGTATGTYSMITEYLTPQETDGETITFTATDIPILANAIHEFTIDWDALSQDEEGVTVQIDSDGDGTFEKTFTANDELTRDKFMRQVSAAEAFPMWIVGVAIAAMAIATAAMAIFRRKRRHPQKDKRN